MNILIATIFDAFYQFHLLYFLPITSSFFSFQYIYFFFLNFKLFVFKHAYSKVHNSFSAFHQTNSSFLFTAFHSSEQSQHFSVSSVPSSNFKTIFTSNGLIICNFLIFLAQLRIEGCFGWRGQQRQGSWSFFVPPDGDALSLILNRCAYCLGQGNWLNNLGCLIVIVYSPFLFLYTDYFAANHFSRPILTTTQQSCQIFVFSFIQFTYSFAFCSSLS